MSPDPVICPKCQSKELDAAGICLVCGAAAGAESADAVKSSPKGEASYNGMIEMDCATAPSSGEAEVPEWRQELSRRLSEIRRRRGLETESAAPRLPFPTPQSKPVAQASAPEPQAAARAVESPKPIVRRPRPVPRVPEKPAPKPVRPILKVEEKLPLFETGEKKVLTEAGPPSGPTKAIPVVTGTGPDKIQRLIDSVVVRQSPEPGAAAGTPVPPPAPKEEPEDKLILVSRTLSGLIDLLIIGLCTGSFIVAADAVSGIDVIDNVSKFYYGALLLAVNLVYSAFFLGTANQTIGMMIKDLRVVGPKGERPGIGQVCGRCAAYVVSWLSLGIGLVWAAFDRQAMCLHDKLSHTRVVRL